MNYHVIYKPVKREIDHMNVNIKSDAVIEVGNHVYFSDLENNALFCK